VQNAVLKGTVSRYRERTRVDAVCVKQLWKEAFGELDNPRRSDSNEIVMIMNNMEGWERSDDRIPSGLYKGQHCWKKVIDKKDDIDCF